jgi:hypothetical protein
MGECTEEADKRIIDLIERSNKAKNDCLRLIQEKRYKEETRLLKNANKNVEVRINDC